MMSNSEAVPSVVIEKPRVLFVDDEQAILNSLKRLSRSCDWQVDFALSGDEALELAEQHSYDVVVSDMRMPEMSGADFLFHMKTRYPDTVRILLTGYSDISALERVVNESGVHNYLTKPWNEFMLQEVVENGFKYAETERERQRLETLTQHQNAKLGKLALLLDKQLKEATIETKQALSILGSQQESAKQNAMSSLSIVTQILDWKEGRDQGHSRFVEQYAVKLAEKLELKENQIELIRIASMVHRIGMLGLPDNIRTKAPYSFNKEEVALYKKYPIWSEVALVNNQDLKDVGKVVRHHQEYVNGQGFPDGLIDKEIPVESKIIGLVGDFYDVYNGRKVNHLSGVEAAKTYIEQWKGKHYDSTIVNAFWDVLGTFGKAEKPIATLTLEQLSIGLVIATDIIVENGLMLLKQGTTLTEENILRLKQYQEKHQCEMEVEIYILSSETNGGP